jgi:hypothetical protein
MHEAREAWSQTRKLIPSVSMDSLRERIPYKRPADLDRLLSGMHRAAME